MGRILAPMIFTSWSYTCEYVTLHCKRNVADIIKVTNYLALKWGEIILDYCGEPNVISRAFKSTALFLADGRTVRGI